MNNIFIQHTYRSCKTLWAAFACCITFTSCKKLVEVPAPKNQLVSASVFSDDQSATSALLGIYSSMMGDFTGFAGGNQSISYLAGLSADEFSDFSFVGGKIQFYTNTLTADNIYALSIWQEAYKYIYQANAILEGISNSTGLSTPVKKQLEGEALFVRAFCYFYLVNLFGDVPIVLTTDYKVNAAAPRSPSQEVYNAIVSDLSTAQEVLTDSYSFSQGEKVRPNKWCAKALLARAFLFQQNWAKAEAESADVINNPHFALENSLLKVFLKNSTEAIWQLQPVYPGLNTFDAYFFVIHSAPRYVALTSEMLGSFELGDRRKTVWIDSIVTSGQTYYFPYKYTVGYGATDVSEYLMGLRLAEQYLIRAEARANENNFAGAQQDLNMIRNRAGLPNTTANDKAALLTAILQERKVELFSEWGHRWLDLKRMGKASEVLGPIKSTYWQPADTLYPIPLSELRKNTHLTQNPGY